MNISLDQNETNELNMMLDQMMGGTQQISDSPVNGDESEPLEDDTGNDNDNDDGDDVFQPIEGNGQQQEQQQEDGDDNGINDSIKHLDSMKDDTPSMMTARFSGAPWFEKMNDISVTLAGIGGIGSWLAFYLSRLGLYKIKLFDGDKVENVNLSGQLFSKKDVGMYKTSVMYQKMRCYSNSTNIMTYTRNFDDSDDGNSVMMCGFDNMEARKLFYVKWKKHIAEWDIPSRHLFIDARLSSEEWQIYCLRGDDEYAMNKYEKEGLFSDSEAESDVCSYKQTTFCAAMVASFMASLFVNWVTIISEPAKFDYVENMSVHSRRFPWFSYYDARNCYLKQEF